MMQMQGIANGLQGMQGGMLPIIPSGLSGMMGGMNMPNPMAANMPMPGMPMPGMSNMQGMGQNSLQPMSTGGFGFDEGAQEGIAAGGDKEDIDQQQQLAAMKYFGGQMNNLQQQAQARMNMQREREQFFMNPNPVGTRC
jgi:hypothetical protein